MPCSLKLTSSIYDFISITPRPLGRLRFCSQQGSSYEFQILVETPESARGHGDRLEEVFAEAITLVDSDALRDLKHEVMSNA